jgi:hypothetical protein
MREIFMSGSMRGAASRPYSTVKLILNKAKTTPYKILSSSANLPG